MIGHWHVACSGSSVSSEEGSGLPDPFRPPRTRSRSLQNIRILLVEDGDDARDVLDRLLTYAGAAVLAASSAEAGLKVLAAVHVDVLVSDIQMPGHDGLWLIREVRARENLRGLPAIAITARAEYRGDILAAGFNAHVPKPIDLDVLSRAIHQFVEARRQGAREL
jgi:CheY-like chemotaxis protein